MLFRSGCEPEDILEKFDGVALAEIYAAVSYALSNLEEITQEIKCEDRLSAQAFRRQEPKGSMAESAS